MDELMDGRAQQYLEEAELLARGCCWWCFRALGSLPAALRLGERETVLGCVVGMADERVSEGGCAQRGGDWSRINKEDTKVRVCV